MGNLLKKRATASEDAKLLKKTEKGKQIVSYAMDGRAIRKGLSKRKRIGIGVFAGIVCLFGVIYVPPLFVGTVDSNSDVPIIPDTSSIKTYQTYLKDHPEYDFDNDGLNNSMEEEYGTDPWKSDTDGDGVTDYAELFITETSPLEVSRALITYTTNKDEKNEEDLSTPYKIDDIIFWPEDYFSKSFGAVVRTISGYRFCNYTGWVKFPESVQAYKYKDGVHYELMHRENEDAWWIDSDDEIMLYRQPLSFVHCLGVFGNTFYLEDDGFGRFCSKVLPDRGGILTSHKVAVVDTQPKTEKESTATLRSPLINLEEPTRFHFNMKTLKDLSWVRKMIDADQCIAVSLYSANAGEAIGIIYGYTEEGDLLVADQSLSPVGKLKITEYAQQMMDKNGDVNQISWYEFEGLGFDSKKYGDRISFFASTVTGTENETIAPSATISSESVVTAEPTTPPETSEQMMEKIEEPIKEEPIESDPKSDIITDEADENNDIETNDNVITFGF